MRVTRRIVRVAALTPLVIAAACGGGETDAGGDTIDDLPSDFYLPDEMTVEGVSSSEDTTSMTGTFAEGDIASIQADMVAGLQAADYELLTNDDIAVLVKNGVGRVRVRTSEFLDQLTVSVDIDDWTDEQLDELRALFAEERIVSGRAAAAVADETYEAEGECRLKGPNRSFLAIDASITVQIDETQDPPFVYADVTTPDGVVYSTEFGADIPYGASDTELFASGLMVEFNNLAAGEVDFSVTTTCDE